jgi:hypothetical protein
MRWLLGAEAVFGGPGGLHGATENASAARDTLGAAQQSSVAEKK